MSCQLLQNLCFVAAFQSAGNWVILAHFPNFKFSVWKLLKAFHRCIALFSVQTTRIVICDHFRYRYTVSIAALVQVLRKHRRNLHTVWWVTRQSREQRETLRRQLLVAQWSRRGPAADTEPGIWCGCGLSCETWNKFLPSSSIVWPPPLC